MGTAALPAHLPRVPAASPLLSASSGLALAVVQLSPQNHLKQRNAHTATPRACRACPAASSVTGSRGRKLLPSHLLLLAARLCLPWASFLFWHRQHGAGSVFCLGLSSVPRELGHQPWTCWHLPALWLHLSIRIKPFRAQQVGKPLAGWGPKGDVILLAFSRVSSAPELGGGQE